MWYAVQVATGREETARDMCRKLLNKESYTNLIDSLSRVSEVIFIHKHHIN